MEDEIQTKKPKFAQHSSLYCCESEFIQCYHISSNCFPLSQFFKHFKHEISNAMRYTMQVFHLCAYTYMFGQQSALLDSLNCAVVKVKPGLTFLLFLLHYFPRALSAWSPRCANAVILLKWTRNLPFFLQCHCWSKCSKWLSVICRHNWKNVNTFVFTNSKNVLLPHSVDQLLENGLWHILLWIATVLQAWKAGFCWPQQRNHFSIHFTYSCLKLSKCIMYFYHCTSKYSLLWQHH